MQIVINYKDQLHIEVVKVAAIINITKNILLSTKLNNFFNYYLFYHIMNHNNCYIQHFVNKFNLSFINITQAYYYLNSTYYYNNLASLIYLQFYI